MKVLTFTTLFPNAIRPHHGIFTETALSHILKTGKIDARVIAPVPWFPFKNQRFGEYAKFAQIPQKETRIGIHVLHPRYPLPPRMGMTIAPFLLATSAKRSLEKLINDGFDFDVIDAHYFYPDGIAAIMLGQHFKKPTIISALGTDINLIPKFLLPRKMIKWAAERASSIVTVCEALRTELIHIGATREKIFALRNGVDLSLFRPVDRQLKRAQLEIKEFTLISVGHLVPRKGHDLVISALTQLPNVHLIIVGEGPEEQRLKELAARENLANRVRFTGVLSQQELRVFYGACDALVLASSREGWANVLLESMACGTPVIASNIWGTPEVVRSSAAGLLMHENTSAGIAKTVLRLRENYPNRASTRAYAEQFSWKETTSKKIELLDRAITHRHPAQ